MSRAVDPLIGSVIAERYEVVREIGKGGMGTIYEVRNTRLGRSFALKTLSSGAQEGEVLARFRREAEIVAKLNHPNILDVVDWDMLEDGSPCMIMEYLRGEDLATRVREGGPLSWPDFARIADQVLAALSVAHRAGVVHRDLKPQNIFLAADDNGDERVKLLDFGISKLRDSRTFTTTDTKVLGTPAYMPPEQAEGRQEDVGPASDVWAMGAILYEMASGKVAFDGPSIPAILYMVCHGRPQPLAELRRDAPAHLLAVIEHALTPNVADRLGSADQLRAELRRALARVEGVSWSDPLRSRTSPIIGQRAPTSTPVSGVPVIAQIVDTGPVAMGATIAVTHEPKLAIGSALTPPVTSAPLALSTAAPTGIQVGSSATTSPRRWRITVVSVAVLVVGILGLNALRSSSHEPHPSASPMTMSSPPVTLPVIPPPIALPPTVPAQVPVTIISTPPGADVFRLPSEARVGFTPWSGQLERAEGTAVFVLKKRGFADSRVEIDQRTGGPANVELSRAATAVAPITKAPTPITPIPVPPLPTHPVRGKGEPVDPFAVKRGS